MSSELSFYATSTIKVSQHELGYHTLPRINQSGGGLDSHAATRFKKTYNSANLQPLARHSTASTVEKIVGTLRP